MGKVCRPFYLFNDYLPPSKPAVEDVQWKILGYYDDMLVGENLFENMEGALDFEKLWHAQRSQSEELCGSYSIQTVFGFRDDDDTKQRDAIFWKDSETADYPFLFFSMLQIDKDICSKESLKKAAALEDSVENTDVKAITYFSIDYSDIILVLKCKKYEDGAKIIEDIHLGKAGLRVSYGYSFASINMKMINKGKCRKELGIARNIQIYIIALELELADVVYNHMLEEIKEKGGEEYIGTISKQGVLGCNDIKFEIGELPWDIFLSFYKQKEGIFNHTSKIYQDNLVGVTTIIGSDYDSNKISTKGLPVANKTGKICENEPVLCRVLVDRCKEWQSRAGKNGEISHLGRYFLSILNSLGKFEVSPIHDYLFQTMLTQMSILIDLAEQALNDEEEMLDYYKENPEAADRGIEQIRNAFFRSAYGFVREFSLLVQNSVRSDRQFTQAPDFDVRVYETPVKLLAFYNAYIYNMKEYLGTFVNDNEEEHEYVFLAYPGVSDFVKLREKFSTISDTKRLFLMELPEINTYRPRDLMFILGHEVAHNVGGGIRNRKERAEITTKIMAYMYVKYIRLSFQKSRQEKGRDKRFKFALYDDIWDEMAEDIETLAEEANEIWIAKNFSKDDPMSNHLKKRIYHREWVVPREKNVMVCIVQMDPKKIWHSLLQREYYYQLDNEEPDKKIEELSQDIHRWGQEFTGETLRGLFDIKGVFSILFYLYKECIADLICIKTLQYSFSEYIELVVRELKYQGQEDFDCITVFSLRSALVTYCMIHCQKYHWKKGDIQCGDNAFTDSDCVKTAKIAKEEMDKYLSRERQEKGKEIKKLADSIKNKKELTRDGISSLTIMEDKYVLKLIAEYLMHCVSKLDELNSEKNEKRDMKRKSVKEMFELFSVEKGGVGTSDIIIDIHKHIANYYNEIGEKNWEKLLKNGEH
ncbi:MAG: hypothetical protein IJI01_01020 [Butyrivibrio sp.]|uniref:hypothetical protein n=1 Tax=Butyrivibrio sp. TaxID=28121 RepID=UPI0025BB45CF|nr:hypothetical protein [Butyrivibrio sp.]MBQ6587241.1 hypothetical protein [Butyrivibrio sp.]